MPTPFTSPPGPATETRTGLVSTIAQIFGGLKRFANGIESAFVRNTNGTSSADTVVSVGTSQAHASVDAQAKILAVLTGLGGTPTELLTVRKGTSFVPPMTLTVPNAGNAVGLVINGGNAGWGGMHWLPSSGGRVAFGAYGGSPGGVETENRGLHFYQNANAFDATALMRFTVGNGATVAASVPCFDYNVPANIQATQRIVRFAITGTDEKWALNNAGVVMADGTDSSGTPGAATINKPSGRSAIASGSTNVKITNSLVAANDCVHVTMHGDLGTQTKPWFVDASVAGEFTIQLSNASANNVSFSWRLEKLV